MARLAHGADLRASTDLSGEMMKPLRRAGEMPCALIRDLCRACLAVGVVMSIPALIWALGIAL